MAELLACAPPMAATLSSPAPAPALEIDYSPSSVLQEDVHEHALGPLRFRSVLTTADGDRDNVAAAVAAATGSNGRAFMSVDVEEGDLVAVVLHMLADDALSFDAPDGRGGLLAAFGIPHPAATAFVSSLRLAYRNVPFHNFAHAVSVAQLLFYWLVHYNIAATLGKVDTFALMLAALCHDVDHPGLNNVFLTNSGSRVAKVHGGKGGGVLEHHHCCSALGLLGDPVRDVLAYAEPPQRAAVLSKLKAGIAATDLCQHKAFLTQLQGIAAGNASTTTPAAASKGWASTPELRDVVGLCLLKAADLGNEVRPSDNAARLAAAVLTEFFEQFRLEKKLGLAVAPHMDPEGTNVAKSQVGFISFLCLPLFESLASIFPQMDECVTQLRTNLKRYKSIQGSLPMGALEVTCAQD
eukprot:m.55147 g.55147  ORF g.55147 m.55147 type:complete len:410 (+) comp12510_c1_seq2:357-1586(+)